MFQDHGGVALLWFWEEFREMHIDCSNVLAELDPWEVVAIASGLGKINQILMTQIGLRSDEEFGIAELIN